MVVDRCPKSADGNHIYRNHGRGCDEFEGFPHFHCEFCDQIRQFNDTTKEWQ